MEPNKQVITKQRLDSKGKLDIHHIFKTIQGEGPFSGRPATFVRLYGCNLQCPMCDTDYTSNKITMTAVQLVAEIVKHEVPGKLVVFSGGEPFRQNIAAVSWLLLELQFTVQIETNGTLFVHHLPYNNPKFIIVCSPKTGKVNKKLAPFIHSYKYVLDCNLKGDDGLPLTALGHSAKPILARPPEDHDLHRIYIQPMDEENDFDNAAHLDAAIRSSQTHGYTLCLQTHKIIGLE